MEKILDSYRKWSAGALLIAGCFLIFGSLFRPDETLPGAWMNDQCGCVYSTYGLGFLFAVFGLVAIYLAVGATLGKITRVAILTAAIASGFLSGAIIILFGYILPLLSQTPAYAPLVAAGGPIQSGMPLFLINGAVLVYSIAVSVVGVKLIRKPLWRLPGVFLLAALILALTPPLPYFVGMIGGVFLGLGHSMLGYRLWKYTAPTLGSESIVS